MVRLDQLVSYCDNYLDAANFNDYCPNGLQVEGKAEINTIVTGVTASEALIREALQQNADLVLVHHGYFWKGEVSPITGMKKNRIKLLLDHDVSLLAYHLPLDAHDVCGNNRQLGERLGINIKGCVADGRLRGLLWYGALPEPMTPVALSRHIESCLGRAPLHLQGGEGSNIRRVAWCTGAAQNFLADAAALGVDAYISGEVSEQTFHVAEELGVHYFGAGHHATETLGVQALGEQLATQFQISHKFINIHNPV